MILTYVHVHSFHRRRQLRQQVWRISKICVYIPNIPCRIAIVSFLSVGSRFSVRLSYRRRQAGESKTHFIVGFRSVGAPVRVTLTVPLVDLTADK